MLTVRWACGSRSIRRTRCSRSARAAPRLTAVVVFPTPPFWLAIAIVFATRMAPSLADGRDDYHAVVVGAAWVGFQRGLVQPLLAELFALVTVLIILHNRGAFVATTDAVFHTGAFLGVVVALVLAGLMGYLGAR